MSELGSNHRIDRTYQKLRFCPIPRASFAQPPRKVWRIGVLQLASKNSYGNTGRQKDVLQGMHEHGYALGTDFTIEERFADGGEVGRLPALAVELVHVGVDLIVNSWYDILSYYGGVPWEVSKLRLPLTRKHLGGLMVWL